MSQTCSLPPRPVQSARGPRALSSPVSPVLYHLVLSSPILRLLCLPFATLSFFFFCSPFPPPSGRAVTFALCRHDLPEIYFYYYSQVKGI